MGALFGMFEWTNIAFVYMSPIDVQADLLSCNGASIDVGNFALSLTIKQVALETVTSARARIVFKRQLLDTKRETYVSTLLELSKVVRGELV